ncbi:hypothetical protein EV195_10587 [Tenacibaculum skagerrakense]|uniref:Endosialidase-like protein n=1 Tax=Tenacibaculum skagerrakense TaxID=186571 RepID=A0A4V2SLU9_9FLAO|nr:hypothetical protein [Tenacibaculum skagerrakense]TCP24656.1 hypothetical protein EV195_10587 [Tenacibaculum skagerrakense]
MKKILLVFFILTTAITFSQNYNPVINYYINGTPTNGVKINTNLPFADGYGMPTLIIEGYDYHSGNTIGLILTYYVYNNIFLKKSVSSFGGFTPEIKLFNENGKVIIFINEKRYFSRFSIRAYEKGKGLNDTHFQNWTITDELPTGTNETIVPYQNKFDGDVRFKDGIWDGSGNVGIGTNTPDRNLTVQGHVNIGGTTNGHLWVRHINGKEPTTANDGNLYLNYSNGKNVWIGGASGSDFVVPKGRIMIGRTSADAPLTVRGTTEDILGRFETATPSDKVKGIRINAKTTGDVFKYFDIALDAESDKAGLGIGTSSGNLPIGKTNLDVAQIVIDKNGGKVGIGTSNPDAKLAVNGTVHAKEVRVDLNNWPDYVFENNYNLPTLEEVEKQIKEKGHLPNIPSAEEVKKNGVQLGEMNKKLLEKIEELTLYTIQQEKDNKKLLSIIKKLEERISKLENK